MIIIQSKPRLKQNQPVISHMLMGKVRAWLVIFIYDYNIKLYNQASVCNMTKCMHVISNFDRHE